MDDPISRPVPEKFFPCPRSAVCIIVTSVSRPDHLRWASINFSLQRRGRCQHPHALAKCSPTRSGGMGVVMLACGRIQNPLAQNDVRAGGPNRRREARWNKWKGQDSNSQPTSCIVVGVRQIPPVFTRVTFLNTVEKPVFRLDFQGKGSGTVSGRKTELPPPSTRPR